MTEARLPTVWIHALVLAAFPGGVTKHILRQRVHHGGDSRRIGAAEFSERELAYLTSAVASINVWNRFGAAFRWTPPARKGAVGAAAS